MWLYVVILVMLILYSLYQTGQNLYILWKKPDYAESERITVIDSVISGIVLIISIILLLIYMTSGKKQTGSSIIATSVVEPQNQAAPILPQRWGYTSYSQLRNP